MKRNLLVLLSFITCGILGAQAVFNFQDDMESYTVDSYVGKSSSNWTVWSGAAGEGTAEDAQITNEVAHSGLNSIRLEAGSASSGPTDLVLPFGGEKNVGKMTYSMWLYITADNAAYFNFQGKPKLGDIWALDNYFTSEGKFICNLGTANNGELCNVDFEFEKWLKYTLVANLTDNIWEVFLNNVSVAKFSNPNNTIASIDIFPLFGGDIAKGASSLFFVDDVTATFEPYVLRTLDAGLVNATFKNKFLAGSSAGGSIQIRNLGTTAITSLELSCNVDNGVPTVATVSNLNVASLGFSTVNVPPITYKKGLTNLNCSITKVNGIADDEPTNNDKVLPLTGVEPAPHKVMVTEEATGTWCQYCPRGAVFLDSMKRTYPDHFIGIAVHNADPMVVPIYDAWLGTFPGFTGYPSIVNDRNQLTDPQTVETDFYEHIVVPTPVILTNGAKYNASTRELEVSVKGDFIADISGDYRFNLVVIENKVAFPGTGYRQVNYYSGRTIIMGGFEKLPNPVPAAKMTYNHVARAIFDDAVGLQGYLPNTIKNGSTYYINYTLTLADTFKSANIELIGLLYGPSGEIVNATETTIAEAEANGLFSSTSNPNPIVSSSKLAPNPSNDFTNLEIDLNENASVSVQVLDLTGREVTSRNYGNLIGNLLLPINTLEFENGSYLIKLSINGKITTSKLVVSH
ncbi:MAG: Omp28-related outer membrane protein [Saprospiraceae bacterium]